MSDEIERLRRWADDTDPERDPISPAEVRSMRSTAAGAVDAGPPAARGPRLLEVAAVVLLLVGVTSAVVAAQLGDGDDDGVVQAGAPPTTEVADAATSTTVAPPTTATTDAPTVPDPTTKGRIGVGLQQAPVFLEGFDYGVRVVRDGEVLAQRSLADFGGDNRQSPTSWTTFEVPPGPAVVESDLNVGQGPPPAPVDFVDACPTAVEVPAEGGVLLQLNWETGCLQPIAAETLPGLSSEPTGTVAAPGPTGSDPAPSELSGSFDGLEEFALFTGRCPFLDHRLDATYTLADGARWAFRSTYCGEIDADNRHHADGEFTFTTADGSTLAGTFQGEAQLPSAGAPYSLQIEQGSGSYAGATGECAIDNRLETLEFGRQRQYGTFSCTLVVDPALGT